MKYYILTYNGKPIGSSGEDFKTKYNRDSSCKFCGSGAIVDNTLIVHKFNKVLKDIFRTIDGDYIISENLYNQMILNNIQVDYLNKITDKEGSVLPFYQLFAKTTLPKAIDIKGLIVENKCIHCKRNGYYNDIKLGDLKAGIPTKICPVGLTYYDNVTSIIKQEDILNSWEEMGISNLELKENKTLRYSRPLLIVSGKIKELLERNKTKNITLQEIKILKAH